MSHQYTITEDAWRLLQKIAAANGAKLEGENSDRNEDGTYTVFVDDDFNDALTRTMRPGETLSDSIERMLGWMNRQPS